MDQEQYTVHKCFWFNKFGVSYAQIIYDVSVYFEFCECSVLNHRRYCIFWAAYLHISWHGAATQYKVVLR